MLKFLLEPNWNQLKMLRTMTVRMMMVVVVVRVVDGADDDDGDHKSRVRGMG